MSNYLLFGGQNYYPNKGWGDFIKSYPSRAAAVEAGWSILYKDIETPSDLEDGGGSTLIEWWLVVDLATEKTVESSWDDANCERADRIEAEYDEPFERRRREAREKFIAAGGVEVTTTSFAWGETPGWPVK